MLAMRTRSTRRTGNSQSYGESSQMPKHRLIAQYGIRWKSRSQGSLVRRMVGKDGRHQKKFPAKCWGGHKPQTNSWPPLSSTSKPPSIRGPSLKDTENALTPAHFLCGERLTALPSGTNGGNLTKAHQRTQTCRRLLETLGKGMPPIVKKRP